MIETIMANPTGDTLHALDFVAGGTLEDLGDALHDHGIAMDQIISLTCRPHEDELENPPIALYRVVYHD